MKWVIENRCKISRLLIYSSFVICAAVLWKVVRFFHLLRMWNIKFLSVFLSLGPNSMRTHFVGYCYCKQGNTFEPRGLTKQNELSAPRMTRNDSWKQIGFTVGSCQWSLFACRTSCSFSFPFRFSVSHVPILVLSVLLKRQFLSNSVLRQVQANAGE